MTASARVDFVEVRRVFDLICDLAPDARHRCYEAERADAATIREVESLLECEAGDTQLRAPVMRALGALPTFKGLDKRSLRDRLIICPGADYLERAFAACEQGVFSPDPALEVTIPSVHDMSLAPPIHVR